MFGIIRKLAGLRRGSLIRQLRVVGTKQFILARPDIPARGHHMVTLMLPEFRFGELSVLAISNSNTQPLLVSSGSSNATTFDKVETLPPLPFVW